MEQVKGIEKFHTKWNIREEKYTDIILTDKLEFHIINLKKLENIKDISKMDKALLNWCKFIVSPEALEEKIMEENKNIENDTSISTTKKPVNSNQSVPKTSSTTTQKTELKKEHSITPIEYETKNETGKKITDEMVAATKKESFTSTDKCENVYLIDGKHVIIISIIVFLLVIMHTLHKLYVNDKN